MELAFRAERSSWDVIPTEGHALQRAEGGECERGKTDVLIAKTLVGNTLIIGGNVVVTHFQKVHAAGICLHEIF
jgi:hypothetical protein